jgi:hypothetical protein
MLKPFTVLCTLALMHATANAAATDPPDAGAQDHWLMMVTTENTVPAKEAQFNAWYDRVDIPDVLEVPGYERARRGKEQIIPASTNPSQLPGKFVALYDIESRAIDKTIIDMLMASWRMEKAHHSTDLLQVTERVYFHQYGPVRVAPAGRVAKGNTYLYMARFNCCRDAAARRKFDHWYGDVYVPRLLTSEAISGVARYRLYRVLMDQPVAIPEFLSVIETHGDTAAQAMQQVSTVSDGLTGADRANVSIAGGKASIFLQINDVRRR